MVWWREDLTARRQGLRMVMLEAVIQTRKRDNTVLGGIQKRGGLKQSDKMRCTATAGRFNSGTCLLR